MCQDPKGPDFVSDLCHRRRGGGGRASPEGGAGFDGTGLEIFLRQTGALKLKPPSVIPIEIDSEKPSLKDQPPSPISRAKAALDNTVGVRGQGKIGDTPSIDPPTMGRFTGETR